MKTLQQIKECGARACAYKMYKDGQGQESNPYPKGSDAHRVFNDEIERIESKKLLKNWGIA